MGFLPKLSPLGIHTPSGLYNIIKDEEPARVWGLGALQHCMPPHFPNDVLTVKECRTLFDTSHEIKSKQLTANSFPKGLLSVLSFSFFLCCSSKLKIKIRT